MADEKRPTDVPNQPRTVLKQLNVTVSGWHITAVAADTQPGSPWRQKRTAKPSGRWRCLEKLKRTLRSEPDQLTTADDRQRITKSHQVEHHWSKSDWLLAINIPETISRGGEIRNQIRRLLPQTAGAKHELQRPRRRACRLDHENESTMRQTSRKTSRKQETHEQGRTPINQQRRCKQLFYDREP